MPSLQAETADGVAKQVVLNVAYVHDWQPTEDRARMQLHSPTTATLDAADHLTGFNDDGPITWPGPVFDAGSDGALLWGRWTRDTIGGNGALSGHSITGAEGVRNSFRYIAGVPAPDAAVAALREAGGAATFSLAGGNTGPTAGEGGGVSITLLTGGSLKLAPGGESVSLDLNFRVASGIYTLRTDAIPLRGAGFTSTEPIPTSGVLCIPGCTAQVQGFFAGAAADRVGLAFSVHNPALSKHINGIAAFARQ